MTGTATVYQPQQQSSASIDDSIATAKVTIDRVEDFYRDEGNITKVICLLSVHVLLCLFPYGRVAILEIHIESIT